MTDASAGGTGHRSYPKGVRRRQQILDSAIALLGQRGVDRASLRTIGEAIGVSHTALRHYLPSRDELLVAACRAHEARAAGEAPAASESAVGPIIEAAERNRSIPGLAELYATLSTDALQEQHAVARSSFAAGSARCASCWPPGSRLGSTPAASRPRHRHHRAAPGGRDRGRRPGAARLRPLLHRLGGRRAILAALLLIAAAMTLLGVALIAGSVPLVAFGFVIARAGIGTLGVLINAEGAVGSGIGATCAALGISPAAQLIGEAVVIVAAAWWTTAAIPPGHHAPADAPARDRTARLRH